MNIITNSFDAIIKYKDILGLIVFAITAISSSARGAMAAVNEIMQAGTLTEEQALQKASDLMGKWYPYIPEVVRKYIIQNMFNSMKTVAKKATTKTPGGDKF
ncbi:MAG: hypothetical protein A2309_02885 [Bacteroidetes bacterium RIFOXYB2_FULL_35_7]|nr:MAG: hypothetical protein A2309_02885 [Bacteroidetes bacterium RIFOXYB2_FULL_35_7]